MVSAPLSDARNSCDCGSRTCANRSTKSHVPFKDFAVCIFVLPFRMQIIMVSVALQKDHLHRSIVDVVAAKVEHSLPQ